MNFFTKTNNFLTYKNTKSFPKYLGENKNYFFSILIPTYQRDEYLLQALLSAISQKFHLPYEIIIVDNNPNNISCNLNPALLEILEMHKNISYYVNENNIGLFGNWNRAGELATADWICYLHDDDTLKLNYLSELYKAIQLLQLNEANFLFSNLDTLEINNIKRKYSLSTHLIFKRLYSLVIPSIEKITPYHFITGNKTHLPGAAIKRSKFIESGGFNEKFYPAADYSFAAYFYHEFKGMYKIKKPIYNYRLEINLSQKLEIKILCAKHDFLLRNFLIDKWSIKSVFVRGFSFYLFKKNYYRLLKKNNPMFKFNFLYKFFEFILLKYDWVRNINING